MSAHILREGITLSAKLRALAQSLSSELDESKETEDAESSKTAWWRRLDWKSPDYQPLFNDLGKETQERIIEAGLTKDDLVEEEYQGNVTMTKSKRAQMFFSIPEDEWAGLSEEEKDDYIRRLPPEKTKAGGEEMSDRDCEDCDEEEEAETDAPDEVADEDEIVEEEVDEKPPREVLKEFNQTMEDLELLVK